MQLNTQKIIYISAGVFFLILVLGAVLFYYYLRSQNQPVWQKIAFSGEITSLEKNAIMVEYFLPNGQDKAIIRVKIDKQTDIIKHTYEIDQQLIDYINSISEPTEEDMAVLEQAEKSSSEEITIEDLQIGDQLEVLGQKNLFNSKEVQAFKIQVIAQNYINVPPEDEQVIEEPVMPEDYYETELPPEELYDLENPEFQPE